MLAKAAERLPAVGGRHHAEAVRVERFGEGLSEDGFVVDDKDRTGHALSRIGAPVNAALADC